MASYSEADAAWVLEKGDYVIRVGNSVMDTEVAAVLTLEEEVKTQIGPVRILFFMYASIMAELGRRRIIHIIFRPSIHCLPRRVHFSGHHIHCGREEEPGDGGISF